MIDTHSHLFEAEFQEDLELCIQRCKENNVHKIILVGFSESTNSKAYDLSLKYDIFYPTAGMHPSEADCDFEKKFQMLVDFIQSHKIYAIGECGLDYHYGKENAEYQKKLFEYQILLAIEKDLPLIVHSRDAMKDTWDILSKYKGKIRAVMHCYSGSWEMAKEYIKLGFYISLGGPVTFKNAVESKRIAKEIPLDKLLVETDCPFLAPTPYRGKRNESAYVWYVVKEIADIRGISFKQVEEQTEKNSKIVLLT